GIGEKAGSWARVCFTLRPGFGLMSLQSLLPLWVHWDGSQSKGGDAEGLDWALREREEWKARCKGRCIPEVLFMLQQDMSREWKQKHRTWEEILSVHRNQAKDPANHYQQPLPRTLHCCPPRARQTVPGTSHSFTPQNPPVSTPEKFSFHRWRNGSSETLRSVPQFKQLVSV
ncbi:hypothetical protein H1C71_014559, partial [Ictidomys tridecemlineatus]